MQCTILVDNCCTKLGLMAEWGYAVHLQTPSGGVLLDTGGQGHILLSNADALGVPLEEVRAIVLSHGHFDHVGGVFDALTRAPEACLWGAPSIATPRHGGKTPTRPNGGGFSLRLEGLHPVQNEACILPGVTAFVVPQEERNPDFIFNDTLWERTPDGTDRHDTFSDDLSLLVEGEHGPSLLLGCAHSGLPNILSYVRKQFHVDHLHAVVGGTHLSAFCKPQLETCIQHLRAYRIDKWRPNHCTGFSAAATLARTFDDVLWAGAGCCINL